MIFLTFLEGLHLPKGTVVLLPAAHCCFLRSVPGAVCRALKARTSRKAGSKDSNMATSHYLDLPSLERWLVEWKDALLSEAGGVIVLMFGLLLLACPMSLLLVEEIPKCHVTVT